jgi:protocatechuate 3,4-dioxygenase beta subunit
MNLKIAAAMFLFTAMQSAAPAAELRGRVVDENEKPIAGARVDIATAAPRKGPGMFCPSCYLDCRKWARTNEQGEFVISGLRPDLKFTVFSSAPGKQSISTKLIDPDAETPTLRLPDFPANTPAGRVLEGQVVSPEGTPIPGALIDPLGAKLADRRWWGTVRAQACVSDEEGRFKLLLGEDYLGVDIRVMADGYAGASMALLKPGKASHRVVVPRGTVVTGTLVVGGKPQAGVDIAVVQINRLAGGHFIKAVAAVTDERGRFEFSALPASQQYAIFSPVGERAQSETIVNDYGYVLSTKLFQARGEDASRDLGKLEMTPGITLAGRLEMTDKSTLPEGIKLALGREPAWDLAEAKVDENGRFEFPSLPVETYNVRVVAKGVSLDASKLKYQATGPDSLGIRLEKPVKDLVVPLRSEPPPDDTQTSRPSAAETPAREKSQGKAEAPPKSGVDLAGRVVKGSQPQPDVKVKLMRGKRVGGDGVRFQLLTEATTDKQGRYRVGGLQPGDDYQLQLENLQGMMVIDWRYDSPYVQTLAADAKGLIEVPDARLISANQKLAGTVVDLDGKPVKGASVSVTLGRGNPLPNRPGAPAPWMDTDARGQFKFDHLPDESLELMVYMKNPAGGFIQYPVQLRPDRNAQDVRVVLDPSLHKAVENLDKK